MLFARTTSLLTILRPASDCFARMLCLYDLQRPPASLSRSLSLSLSFPQCSPQMAYGPGFVFAQLYPGLWGKTGQETAVWIHDKKKSPEFPLQGSKQVETFPLEFSSTLSFVPGLFFPSIPLTRIGLPVGLRQIWEPVGWEGAKPGLPYIESPFPRIVYWCF
jgi:hypothetical protein